MRAIQSKNIKNKNNSPNTIVYTEKKQKKFSKNINQSNRLMGFSLNNENKKCLNSVNNEKEQEQNLNQTMANTFQRIQKNIIIKRDEKNDIRINSPKYRNKKSNSRINQMKSTVVNHNYNLPYDSNENKSNLNINQSSSIKKTPLDGGK